MPVFNTDLFTEIDYTLSKKINKIWTGTDDEFFHHTDKIKAHIDQDGAICIVHCKFSGCRYPADLDFLVWICDFYKTTQKNTRLIWVHCDDYPEFQGIDKIHFFRFPEYFAYYYPLFAGFNASATEIVRKFLCLNKRASLERQIFYRAFDYHSLLEDSWFSYIGQSRYLGPVESQERDDLVDIELDRAVDEGKWPELSTWPKPKSPWRYISESDHELIDNEWKQWNEMDGFASGIEEPTWQINPEYYQGSFCSVIIETAPGSWRINISEKTIRVLAHGHPFIMVGCAGTVQLLRDLGFDVYDDIIDHSYDNINDHVPRLKAAWESVMKVAACDLKTLQQVSTSLLPRRQKNIAHLSFLYESMFRRQKEIAIELEKITGVEIATRVSDEPVISKDL